MAVPMIVPGTDSMPNHSLTVAFTRGENTVNRTATKSRIDSAPVNVRVGVAHVHVLYDTRCTVPAGVRSTI
jgi:hypothetical protein